jgi:hypothetical protein
MGEDRVSWDWEADWGAEVMAALRARRSSSKERMEASNSV